MGLMVARGYALAFTAALSVVFAGWAVSGEGAGVEPMEDMSCVYEPRVFLSWVLPRLVDLAEACVPEVPSPAVVRQLLEDRSLLGSWASRLSLAVEAFERLGDVSGAREAREALDLLALARERWRARCRSEVGRASVLAAAGVRPPPSWVCLSPARDGAVLAAARPSALWAVSGRPAFSQWGALFVTAFAHERWLSSRPPNYLLLCVPSWLPRSPALPRLVEVVPPGLSVVLDGVSVPVADTFAVLWDPADASSMFADPRAAFAAASRVAGSLV